MAHTNGNGHPPQFHHHVNNNQPPLIHHDHYHHNLHRIIITDLQDIELIVPQVLEQQDVELIQEFAEHIPAVPNENMFVYHHPNPAVVQPNGIHVASNGNGLLHAQEIQEVHHYVHLHYHYLNENEALNQEEFTTEPSQERRVEIEDRYNDVLQHHTHVNLHYQINENQFQGQHETSSSSSSDDDNPFFVGDMDEDEEDPPVVNIFLLRFVTFSTPHLYPPHVPKFNRISTSWLCDSQFQHKKYVFSASRQLSVLGKKFVAVTAKPSAKFLNSAKNYGADAFDDQNPDNHLGFHPYDLKLNPKAYVHDPDLEADQDMGLDPSNCPNLMIFEVNPGSSPKQNVDPGSNVNAGVDSCYAVERATGHLDMYGSCVNLENPGVNVVPGDVGYHVGIFGQVLNVKMIVIGDKKNVEQGRNWGQDVNFGTGVQGACCTLKDSDMNARLVKVEESNVHVDTGHVADPGVIGGEVNVSDMEVDGKSVELGFNVGEIGSTGTGVRRVQGACCRLKDLDTIVRSVEVDNLKINADSGHVADPGVNVSNMEVHGESVKLGISVGQIASIGTGVQGLQGADGYLKYLNMNTRSVNYEEDLEEDADSGDVADPEANNGHELNVVNMEADGDMEIVLGINLEKGVNVGGALHGTGTSLKDLGTSVNPNNLEDEGNVAYPETTESQGNSADIEADGDQVKVDGQSEK